MSRDVTAEQLRAAVEALGLDPMVPLSVSQATSVSDLLKRMANTAFTGRRLGEAADVTEAMLRDDTFVVLTLSGAMTMAGMSDLILQMIERKWIDCIVATGALVGHGLVENLGMTHYKAAAQVSDEQYFAHGLNRVYDVIEPEYNLDTMELEVREILGDLADRRNEPVGTAELLAFLGEQLPGRGVLQSAARHGVAVFIPAFSDSELGLDFAVHVLRRRAMGKPAAQYDAMRDIFQYAALVEGAVAAGKHLGIFTVGGGVPRNWAQQVGPYVDVRSKRLDLPAADVRFKYGVRICPDPVHYGHLSGCTYSEGVSWGKFISPADGGRFAEVLLDATVGWPLIVRALIDRGL